MGGNGAERIHARSLVGECLLPRFISASGSTHPFLDGIMHADIRPLMPFAPGNPFLGLIGLGALHLALVAAGVVGLALLAIPRARP